MDKHCQKFRTIGQHLVKTRSQTYKRLFILFLFFIHLFVIVGLLTLCCIIGFVISKCQLIIGRGHKKITLHSILKENVK